MFAIFLLHSQVAVFSFGFELITYGLWLAVVFAFGFKLIA
jgi:hypothetical protein